MRTYTMSDIHGQWEAFEESLALVPLGEPDVRLVLLGDYIDHDWSRPETFSQVKALQERHPGRVIVLMGNNDDAYATYEGDTLDPSVLRWLRALPPYYETDDQIYVHSGVDEEAGDLWRWGSEDAYFWSKFPPSQGPFIKDVVAGHMGACAFCGEHRVWWDGASHYYIDGSTETSGFVPVLVFDDVSGRYTTFERSDDDWREVPVTPPLPGEGDRIRDLAERVMDRLREDEG